MRTEIEVRLRCCWCRADNFATWLVPKGQPSPSRAALDHFIAQQLEDFSCKECGGPRGATVAVYRADDVEERRA